ncbi:MAG: TPM domain-containing protein [Candidatus Omnitrophica bacterium]|nr:TPM domain-containing protein [Candidatus Omnitrophota bacterium]MBU4140355.1 TPM domain-containing protein [Candidatus Omnitrophota bacterium]
MRFTHKLIFVLLAGFLCFASALSAEEPAFPEPQGFINDFAGLIAPSDFQQLNALAQALKQKTTAEITVVTLKTTKPYDIQDYSVRLFEKWKIGKAGKDNGVLLLVAVEDKKAWITTGYGLEGAIPDAAASKIYRNIIAPYFKKGEFSKGILAGSIVIVDLAAREYNVSIEDLPKLTQQYVRPVEKSPLASFIQGLFTLLFFVLFFGLRLGLFGFLLLGTGRRRGGYWYGGGLSGNSGGFGGGFGGFGGGFTGGGGAGGGW